VSTRSQQGARELTPSVLVSSSPTASGLARRIEGAPVVEKLELIVVVLGDEIIVRRWDFMRLTARPLTSRNWFCGTALKPKTTSCWPPL
jgi:hypothetical protein